MAHWGHSRDRSTATHCTSWRPIAAATALACLTLACADAPTAVTTPPAEASTAESDSLGEDVETAATWTLKNLGTLPGGTYSESYGINAQGWVVGVGDWDDGAGCATARSAFIYKNNAIVNLGQFASNPCSGWSVALDVNDAGTTVGWESAFGDRVAGKWDAKGAYQAVAFGCQDAEALGINNAGTIVGWFGDCNIPTIGNQHPFVWTQANGQVDALPPGYTTGIAVDINDNGVIVGLLDFKPARWTLGGPVTLIPGGFTTVGGQVTTYALGTSASVGFVGGDGTTAWKFNSGVFAALPAFAPGGVATDISVKGRIVGWRTPGSAQAVTQSASGVVTPLASLNNNKSIAYAAAVNKCGGIAGYSPDGSGRNRAVVWRIRTCDP